MKTVALKTLNEGQFFMDFELYKVIAKKDNFVFCHVVGHGCNVRFPGNFKVSPLTDDEVREIREMGVI